ncbi:Uncharacterised protein [Raoultella terrigena]|uniref:TrmO C-terminal domain-containing protein n=1 Tax=Raoultella terrigena TaxID=577 RepID=A0A4U9D8A9_RAOTE|nr:Uncharacterised protein [Raoultella terrigena]
MPCWKKRYPQLKAFIREVLAQDPRPAYRKEEEAGKTYAVWLLDFNVRWRVIASGLKSFLWNHANFIFLSFGIFATLVN